MTDSRNIMTVISGKLNRNNYYCGRGRERGRVKDYIYNLTAVKKVCAS